MAAFVAETGTLAGWWLDRGASAWREPDGRLVCLAVQPLDPVLRETLEAAGGEAIVELRLATRAAATAALHDLARSEGGPVASDARGCASWRRRRP